MSNVIRIPANAQAYLYVMRDSAQDKFDVKKLVWFLNEETVTFPEPLQYFKFDETSGTRADSIGNGDCYDIDPTVGYTIAKVGNGVTLARSSGSMATCEGDSLHPSTLSDWDFPTTGYTVAFWAKATCSAQYEQSLMVGFSQDGYMIYFYFASYEPDEEWTENAGYYCMVNDDNYVKYYCSDNDWHFFVIWYDPNDTTLHMRVDNGTPTSVSVNAPTHTEGYSFTYGVYEVALPVGNGTGAVDELGLWGQILTAEQQSYLFNSGTGKTYPFSDYTG